MSLELSLADIGFPNYPRSWSERHTAEIETVKVVEKLKPLPQTIKLIFLGKRNEPRLLVEAHQLV